MYITQRVTQLNLPPPLGRTALPLLDAVLKTKEEYIMQKRAARRGTRALAFLLCLLMVVSLLPVMGASAAEGNTNEIGKDAAQTSDGIVVDKYLEENSNGNYTVTLEAYVTGTVEVKPDTVAPLDIVLVLDQSGSMADGIKVYERDLDITKTYYLSSEECEDGTSVTWNGSSWGYSYGHGQYWYAVTPKTSANDSSWDHTQLYETRLSALKTAVSTFVSTVEQNAAEYSVDHRIAIVGFASDSGYGNNTEILSVTGNNSTINSTITGTTTRVGVQYSSNNNTAYTDATKAAFQDTTTDSGKNMLDNAIKALAAQGATRTDLGMKMAQDILAQDAKKDEEGRTKLVIMFTDGTPTSEDRFDTTVANNAISSAKTIKESATVYTIGIFDGADPTSLNSNENKFMNYVSSNYPTATNMNTPGTRTDNSFYLAASDTAGLNDIFKSIQGSITGSASYNLDATAVLQDVIASEFTVPDNVEITAESYKCTGQNADGSYTWSSTPENATYTTARNGNTVTVTGFDYSENFVSVDSNNTAYGQKLVVKISGLIPNEAGDHLYSNDNDTSGIYNGETLVVNFPKPWTKIPVYTKVLDFSMTANIAAAVQQLSKNSKTYGNFELKNENLTYNLNTRVESGNLVFDGVDSVLFYGDYNDDADDQSRWNKVNVIPANNVYYDDDLLTEQSTFTDSDYGYDVKVPDTTGTVNVSQQTQKVFTFAGTGIDVYCTTQPTSGAVYAQLRALDQDGNVISSLVMDADGNKVKDVSMNNTYQSNGSDGILNVPTLSFTGLEYGKYQLTISTGTNENYKLDGVRIYNPANLSDSASAADKDVINSAYAADNEANAVFTQVRDILIDNNSFTDGYDGTEINGVVFIDQIGTEPTKTNDSTSDIGTYETYGPKNEVYLAKGQGIAFKVNGFNSDTMRLEIGLSAPTANTTGSVELTNGVAKSMQSLEKTTDMYYNVVPDSNGYVYVKNISEALVSVTNIKVTAKTTEADTSAVTFSLDGDLLAYIADFDTLNVATPDVEPDPTPDTTPNQTTITATINAIWNRVMNGIAKLFGHI